MRRLFWVLALAVALALAPVTASAGGIRARIDNYGGHDSQGVGRGDPGGGMQNPTKVSNDHLSARYRTISFVLFGGLGSSPTLIFPHTIWFENHIVVIYTGERHGK